MKGHHDPLSVLNPVALDQNADFCVRFFCHKTGYRISVLIGIIEKICIRCDSRNQGDHAGILLRQFLHGQTDALILFNTDNFFIQESIQLFTDPLPLLSVLPLSLILNQFLR